MKNTLSTKRVKSGVEASVSWLTIAYPRRAFSDGRTVSASVTWPEAVALGIDDLEHGPVFSDTEFVADKKSDVCPAGGGSSSWAKQDMTGAKVQEMIRDLVSHHVAVTSTLPVFESGAPGQPVLQPRTLDAMSAESA
jgi:hypothetical protein